MLLASPSSVSMPITRPILIQQIETTQFALELAEVILGGVHFSARTKSSLGLHLLPLRAPLLPMTPLLRSSLLLTRHFIRRSDQKVESTFQTLPFYLEWPSFGHLCSLHLAPPNSTLICTFFIYCDQCRQRVFVSKQFLILFIYIFLTFLPHTLVTVLLIQLTHAMF